MVFEVIKENGNKIGMIKFDSNRKSNLWTALGMDGSRIADVASRTIALELIKNQK